MKMILRKTIILTCIFSMILGLYRPMPVRAYAFENENKSGMLWVGDTKMIKESELYQTTAIGDKGKAVYDYENNILTLDNLELTGTQTIAIQDLDGLIIVVKGTVKLHCLSGHAIEVFQDGPLSIIGEDGGNLIIDSGSAEKTGTGISCDHAQTHIKNLNINIFSSGACIYGANISIENCKINVKSYLTDRLAADNMKYYVDGNSLPSIGGGAYTIKNSTIDAEGANMGIGFFRSFTCDADAVITDTSGNNLNRVRIHERDNIYSYSFSKQPDNQTYEGFDVAEKHVIIKNNHQMTKHDAVTPTCTHGGNTEYYYCNSCGIYFSDAEGNNQITLESTVLPVNPNNHVAGVPVKENEVAATSSSGGSYDEVVYCTECKAELSRTKITTEKLSETKGVSQTEVEDVPKQTYYKLKARASKSTNTSIKLNWSKIKSADGYLIYGNKCGTKNEYKLIKTISKNTTTSFTQKKLKKGTYYRYMVVAYKNVDGKRRAIVASKPIYATTTGGKYGNPKSVKVTKSTITIKKGKTARTSATTVKEKKSFKTYRKLSYETSNKKIATVSSKGVIKGIKKGTCYVYVYAQNGVSRKVKVVVK